jgi:cytochrome P450
MALIELRVVLATLLRKFRVKLDNASQVFPVPAVTLRPHQLLVSVVPR